MAQKIAAQAGELKLESVASITDAELQAGQGKTGQALQLYQHALKLDSNSDDSQATASDLYSCGLFLRDSGLSPRLAYACLLKAESLMQHLTNASELNSVVRAREDLEKRLAGQSSEVRRNPDSVLQEALAATLP